jgi:predicted phage-related endonuclease
MANKLEINLVIKNLKDLYTKEAELKEAISNQEAIIKEYLTDNKLEIVTVENGTATWKEVLSKTLDMKAFRQAYENLYQLYAVKKVTRRFKVA